MAAIGKLAILEQLDKPNEVLSSVWALAPSSSPFVSSSPEKGKDEKVLEFSKFLSDKQQALKSSVERNSFGTTLPAKYRLHPLEFLQGKYFKSLVVECRSCFVGGTLNRVQIT